MVGVGEELRQIEELWYEFPDVGHVVFGGRAPGVLHTVEHPVCQIKVAALWVTAGETSGQRGDFRLVMEIPGRVGGFLSAWDFHGRRKRGGGRRVPRS